MVDTVDHSALTPEQLEQQISEFGDIFNSVRTELKRVIVGMEDVLQLTLVSVFAGGHVLLEGAPGLGKTLLVKSLAKAMGLSFNRIQFTSDLMPSDVTGTQVLTEDENHRRGFQFKPGPIFANIVLADEVNRSGPKTQSALLEAMEEKQVSVLGQTHSLPLPFFVLATQNPIELEGTYPLPEAQLDRFLLKVVLSSPTAPELKEILARTTGAKVNQAEAVFSPDKAADQILSLRNLVRSVVVAPPIEDLLVGTIFALSPQASSCTEAVSEYVRYGPGPRGAQSVLLAAKVFALLDGRINLAYEDITKVIVPSLRHRLILNYQAEAEGVTADQLIEEVRDRA